MRIFLHEPAHSKIKDKSGFWLALIFALVLHGVFLFVPITLQAPDTERVSDQIEVQLSTTYKKDVVQQKPEPQADKLPEKPEPEPLPDPLPKPEPVEPEKLAATTPLRKQDHDPAKMTAAQKARLTSTILSRQFISEESATDRIFGKPIAQPATEPQKEFHYPARQNMMTMLDQPMPDLPFAYTPDLVYFAYDTGVRGDLQRFWDVITPEFGWRTDNGTEFKCKWVLIIAACGWK